MSTESIKATPYSQTDDDLEAWLEDLEYDRCAY
jgi:hypothetical protein